MAKPSNVQKPPLQCCTMAGNDWPVERIPASRTPKVRSAEKTNGEGRYFCTRLTLMRVRVLNMGDASFLWLCKGFNQVLEVGYAFELQGDMIKPGLHRADWRSPDDSRATVFQLLRCARWPAPHPGRHRCTAWPGLSLRRGGSSRAAG